MRGDGRDAEDDTFGPVDEARGRHLPDALTRSWLAWVFVVLAVGFVGWYVQFQALPAGASAANVVIHILQLVPSVCAILVPAALLARHPDARNRAGGLLVGAVLFALVQGLVVLADPLQGVFESVTPPSQDLPSIVPLEVVYSGLISLVAAFAVGYIAVGLSGARRYEDRTPSWLSAWLVPVVTIFGTVVGVLAAERFYGDAPMSPFLAAYLAATIIFGVVRLIVWAYLLSVGVRGALAGEDPRPGWTLVTFGAALVLISLVLVNVTNTIDLPTETVAAWVGYAIVVGYALGNVLVLAAFTVGLPELDGYEDEDEDEDEDAGDDWDDDAEDLSRRG